MSQRGLERDFAYLNVNDPPLAQPYRGVRIQHTGPVSQLHISTSSNDDFPPPPPPQQSYYPTDDAALPPPPDTTSHRYQGYGSPRTQSYGPGLSGGDYADVSGLQGASLGHAFPVATKSAAVIAVDDKEAKVDALTSQLLQGMAATSDPQFLGMCAKCNKRVMGEHNGCNAMDKLYHISCFTCLVCHQLLQGQSFFSMESKPYCEACYVNTLEKCSVCSKPITDRLLRATGKPYHPGCFTCVVCGKSLDGIPFTVDATNQIHCIDDFHKKFAPRCCVCQRPIMPEEGQDETVRVVAMDRSFHISCYRCQDCGSLLSSEVEGRGCYPLDELILCKNCNAKRIQGLTSNLSTAL